MKKEEVEKLLARFYEGETSVKEEQELRHYFETEDIPKSLQADKELFSVLTDNTEVKIPINMGSKLSQAIDQWAEAENRAINIKHNRKIYWQWTSGIAASILLLFGIWTYVDKDDNGKPVVADTYTNPEDAYKEAQKALALVSFNLNKGVKQLENAQQKTEKAEEIFKNTINSTK